MQHAWTNGGGGRGGGRLGSFTNIGGAARDDCSQDTAIISLDIGDQNKNISDFNKSYD